MAAPPMSKGGAAGALRTCFAPAWTAVGRRGELPIGWGISARGDRRHGRYGAEPLGASAEIAVKAQAENDYAASCHDGNKEVARDDW